MKFKRLAAVMLLSITGVAGAMAQDDCKANSSISHQAVKSGNYKDAYAPCMAVLKECPTLRYYTYSDAMEILRALMTEYEDRNLPRYLEYFEELMQVHDLRMKHIPDFIAKGTEVTISIEGALGAKAIDYLQYAPSPDIEQAYAWLKESVNADKENAQAAVLHYFMDISLKKLKTDAGFKDEFLHNYMNVSQYVEKAIISATKSGTKKNLEAARSNIAAMLAGSGMYDCAALQDIYSPLIETHKADSVFLKHVVFTFRVLKCNDNDAYSMASEYLYALNPTADTATEIAYIYYKKNECDTALKFFNEALDKETDTIKKAVIAYAAAVALYQEKKFPEAKAYCQKAIEYRQDYGEPYILLATMYGSSPGWSNETALNKCTYFLVIDKLQKAKTTDPTVAEKADELIETYSKHVPNMQDLFMLGYKTGDRIHIGGWIDESTTIR